jgi:hypothetical protein
MKTLVIEAAKAIGLIFAMFAVVIGLAVIGHPISGL